MSLNAGLDDDEIDPLENVEHLQNDAIFPDKDKIEQVPELNDGIEVIAALESRLLDLQYLANDMAKHGGMNQTYAAEAQRLLPGFDGEKAIGYYTQQVSATRYKIAAEEIHKGVIVLIAAAIAAILAMIYKVIRWLMGDKKAMTPAGSSPSKPLLVSAYTKDVEKKVKEDILRIDNLEKGLNDIVESIEDVAEAVAPGIEIKDQNNHAFVEDEINRIVLMVINESPNKAEAFNFLESKDPFFHDLLNNGAYSQVISEIIHPMIQVQQIMGLKIKMIDDMIQRETLYELSVIGDMMLNSEIRLIRDPIRINFKGKEMLLQDVLLEVTKIRNAVSTHHVSEATNFARVFSGLAGVLEKGPIKRMMESTMPMMHTLSDLERIFSELRTVLGNSNTDGKYGAPSRDNGPAIRDLVDVISRDIADMANLLRMLDQYRITVETIVNKALGFAYISATRIAKMMSTTETNTFAPKALAELAKLAEQIRSDHSKHFMKFNPIG